MASTDILLFVIKKVRPEESFISDSTLPEANLVKLTPYFPFVITLSYSRCLAFSRNPISASSRPARPSSIKHDQRSSLPHWRLDSFIVYANKRNLRAKGKTKLKYYIVDGTKLFKARLYRIKLYRLGSADYDWGFSVIRAWRVCSSPVGL